LEITFPVPFFFTGKFASGKYAHKSSKRLFSDSAFILLSVITFLKSLVNSPFVLLSGANKALLSSIGAISF